MMQGRILASRYPGNRFFNASIVPPLAILRQSLLNLTLGHSLMGSARHFTGGTATMDLPVGYDDFREVIENKLDFVDKSLFIKEVIEDKSTKAAVITRPRRFGKTFNLSMLHHFLAHEIDGKPTQGLFDHLKITQWQDLCGEHQGKYPVIFITFKGVKDHRYEATYNNLCKLMSRVYLKHQDVLSSPKLAAHQKKVFESIVEERATEASIQSSLLDLTHVLYLHHGIKPWLLMDEYDTPIQASYVHGYYKPLISLMRNLFGDALKTNPYLHKAVITGIVRIAKENLFSGVNNLKVFSMLDSRYSEYFGFTEEEVDSLLKKSQLEGNAEQIKEWYNGYRIGNTTLYNPWSIANCVQEKGKLTPYWVNTGDNQLIRDLLVRSSTEFKAQFESLLLGQPIERIIDESMVFDDLFIHESATWNLLLTAGYLKVISQRETDQGLVCVLDIPNREVRNLYRQIIERWLSNGHGVEWYNNFLNHLLTGNLDAFERELTKIMEQTVSVHDTARDPEAFYHGLMIGITASLYQSKNYEIQSNRESGYGRYDYMIFSHDKNKPSLLLEFKRVESVKDTERLTTKLEQAAQEAVEQIRKTRYSAEAEKRGSTNIIKMGIAFCGKRFKIYAEQGGKELTTKPSQPALGC